MNHIEFIEKHVCEELIKQGFSVTVAQGGHGRRSTCTSACLRLAVRGGFSRMFYVTQNCGQRNNNCLQTSSGRSALRVAVNRPDCSERVKAEVLEHQRLSGAITAKQSQERVCQILLKYSISQ